MKKLVDLIIIGGSWGGIQASMTIAEALPADYKIPILLVLHRLKNFESDLVHLYQKKTALQVKEVDEKQAILPGHLYIAPANYHVLVEKDKTFSLDDSELENYSRPSIDVTFNNASDVYKDRLAGILLSGANRDGSKGLLHIKENGGVVIVQNPTEAEVESMPQSAIDLMPDCTVFSLKRIQEFLLAIE